LRFGVAVDSPAGERGRHANGFYGECDPVGGRRGGDTRRRRPSRRRGEWTWLGAERYFLYMYLTCTGTERLHGATIPSKAGPSRSVLVPAVGTLPGPKGARILQQVAYGAAAPYPVPCESNLGDGVLDALWWCWAADYIIPAVKVTLLPNIATPRSCSLLCTLPQPPKAAQRPQDPSCGRSDVCRQALRVLGMRYVFAR
jgi:hypothetical protein